MFSQPGTSGAGENKLNWMYQGATSLVDREEYLLGRSVDKTLDELNVQEKQHQVTASGIAPKNHVEHECIPPSIREYKQQQAADQVDIAAKLQEDPLFAIKKREEESRKQFLQNPIQMAKLQRALKKRDKKLEKERKRCLKEAQRARKGKRSSDDKRHKLYEHIDDDTLDVILVHKFNALRHLISDEELQSVLRGEISSSSSSDSDSDNGTRKKRKKIKKKLSDATDAEDDSDSRIRNHKKNFRIMKHTEYNSSQHVHKTKTQSKSRESRYADNKVKTCKHQRKNYSDSDDSPTESKARKRHKSPESDTEYIRKHEKSNDDRRNKHFSENHSKSQHSKSTSSKRRGHSTCSGTRVDSLNSQSRREHSRNVESTRFRRDDNTRKSRHSDSDEREYKKKSNYESSNRSRKVSKKANSDSEDDHKSKRESRKAYDEPLKKHSNDDYATRDISKLFPTTREGREIADDVLGETSNSDDDRKNQAKPKFGGLVAADGTKIKLTGKPNPHTYARPSSSKADSPLLSKQTPARPRERLTEQERDRRRKEMMHNAEWREKERDKNVKRYRKEDIDEVKDYKFDPEFVHKEIAKSTASDTVESRIKANRNNIQRSASSMNSHFSKR